MNEHQQQFLQAQRALKAGHKREARVLLQAILRAEPENTQAWLWLAAATPSPRASLNYVARAEKLRPGDETVARARAWAEARMAAAEPPPTLAPAARPALPQPAGAPTAAAAPPARRGRPLLWALGLLALVAVAAGAWWMGQQVFSAQEQIREVTARGEGTAPAPAQAGYFEPVQPDKTAPTATPTAPLRREGQISAKPLAAEEQSAAWPTWTVTPSPTPTPSPSPTVLPTFVSNRTNPQPVSRPPGVGPNERWVDVNLTVQKLVAYEGNTPVFESLVSSGMYNHPTVTGQFRVWLRFSSQTMDGRRLGYDYYLENVPYVMYFYEDYALHGTFWHNNFGTPMSHGCVNLPTPAAEWIFNWSEIGTLVNVHY